MKGYDVRVRQKLKTEAGISKKGSAFVL